MANKNLLEHAFINQLEADFESNNFESMSYLIQTLLKNKENREAVLGYLSDTVKENLLEGRTKTRY